MTPLPVLAGFRVARPDHSPGAWREARVAPRGATRLGISFRPLQAEAMGLNPMQAMVDLLARPFDLIRLPAYWSLIEPGPAGRHFDALDRQVDAAQHAGKQLILAVGAVKNFGYPEVFVPAHRLPDPVREGSVIDPEGWPSLLAAAVEFVSAVVERYRNCSRLIAWQVEHEAVDPLGMEHSWRLATAEPHKNLNCSFQLVRSGGAWLVSDAKCSFVPGHGP